MAEREVALKDVPEAVRATILKEASGRRLTKVEAKVRGGQSVYEAEWFVGDAEFEVKVSPDGRVLARERSLTLDQVPAPVSKTILKEAGDYEVKEVEVITAGNVLTYEAEWVADCDEIEITLAADGTVLGRQIKAVGEDG
jgi:uncharacterized membrane protein YkoI